MGNNIVITSLKYIAIDIVGNVLYFPIWWYAQGLKKTTLFCLRKIADGEKRLGLKIWLTNLFKPMFGQYDWQGKIISFFVRLIQLIFRTVFMVVWIFLVVIFFIFYLVLPLFVIYQIFYHLF